MIEVIISVESLINLIISEVVHMTKMVSSDFRFLSTEEQYKYLIQQLITIIY